MSKRSTIATETRGWWPTPPEAVLPLIDALPGRIMFVEPCAGDGVLARTLQDAGHLCVDAFDLEPQARFVRRGDARTATIQNIVVTNPPFERGLLCPILDNLLPQNRLWLLLPLDHLANLWFSPYAPHVREIVPIGRVSWMGNGKAGKDNNAWVRFDPTPSIPPMLHPRRPKLDPLA